MELRYCEECGNAIQVERSKPFSLDDSYVCDDCRLGRPEPAKARRSKAQEVRLEAVVEAGRLNLFSSQTIALHKQKQESEADAQKTKSTRLRLVKGGSEPASPGGEAGIPGAAAAPKPPSPVAGGSSSPARSAQRILFRCLHCKATLSIRPVEKTSKLTCPQCTKEIYVTASGRLLKSSPSAVVKTGSAALPAVPGSVRIAKPGTQRGEGRGGSASQGEPREAEEGDAAAAASRDAGSPALAPPPGSARASAPKAGSVRLAAAPPRPAPAVKPPSAFEEHQARQDPEKTVFITEEPTEDLGQLASSGVLKSVAERFDAPPPVPRRGASAAGGILLPDDGDLLEIDSECVGVPAGGVPEAREDAPSTPAQAPSRPGLAQRVLKALFSP